MENLHNLEEEIFRLKTDLLKHKKVLFDHTTDLPTISYILDDLKREMDECRIIGIICINIVGFTKVENIYGWQIYERLLNEVALTLKTAKFLVDKHILALGSVRGDEFLIFVLSSSEGREVTIPYLEMLGDKINSAITNRLHKVGQELELLTPQISIGCALITNNPLVRPERSIYRSIDTARSMASFQEQKDNIRRKEELKRIIVREEVGVRFQPIVFLDTFEILAYEALAVMPKDIYFENTESIFSFATETNMNVELDRVCRKKALLRAPEVQKYSLLFLNTDPQAIEDPEFRRMQDEFFSTNSEIDPQKIVFEITERSAITNYKAFHKALQSFKDIGIKIAVDDAGAGYASLNSIAELKPDFLKFDHALVKDINTELIKQELLKTLLTFSEKIGAKVIAEGIETEAEYKTLLNLGVPLGQGYYLARPGEILPTNKVR